MELRHWILEALLIAAAVLDWRSARLPNLLTLGGLALGLVLSVLPQGIGIGNAAAGAASMFVLLLPIWMLRLTGAGDVKLLMLVGAFLGLPDIFFALLLTLLAGGLFALGYSAMHGRLARMAANTRDLLQFAVVAASQRSGALFAMPASVGKLPYGVAVCAGVSTWLIWQGLAR